ncbi:hypothetical protein TB2_006194 [Malus domestica]
MAMQLGSLLLCVVLLTGFSLTNSKADTTYPPVHCDILNRSSFEPGFIFGTASSAYQVEGAWKEGGRGPSIWDTFTHNHPEKIMDGSNGDVAIDQYHRYKEDVRIMKDMGMDAYRFSISWSRVLPNGTLSGGVNTKGIEYYNNLIDELLDNGLKPFVTIFHWDVPQTLEDEYGGFLSSRIVDHFKDYAELCFKYFGDRVKHWITVNEPYTFTTNGYATGKHAPGRCSAWQNLNCTDGNSATEPYLVTHHQLLAHGAAVKLYKDKYQECQNGVIGITLVSPWFEPSSKAKHDIDAAFRSLDFVFGWQVYMDPLTNGDYPHSMRSLVKERLPKFTDEESKLINGSFDFIGVNYYTARYASKLLQNSSEPASYLSDPCVNITAERNNKSIGLQAGSDWLYVYPKGIHDLVVYTMKKYNDPFIYITENGIDEVNDPNLPLEEALNDIARIDYYREHLCYLQAAIKKGVKVKGYFAWSVLDNFEWNDGYTVRFGIKFVDYDHGLRRYSKKSTYWFKRFLNKAGRNLNIVDSNVVDTKFVYEV